jgi:outer membrane receptor protein involved in Fe transport
MDKGTKNEKCTDSEGRPERNMGYRYQLLLGALLVTSGAWADAPKYKFDLPANEFPSTILEFYHQSHVEVIYSTNDNLRSIKTHPVSGEFEPTEALQLLLRGTPLTYETDPDGSIIIKRIQPQEVTVGGASEHSGLHLAVAETADPYELKQLEQVVVTGTLLHGVTDVIAPLIHVDRQQLTQSSYGTVQDVLYGLPMNSLDAPREDFGLNNNYNFGTGVNLRGLGVGATLVLINGQRQPLSGLNADFVDVSNIPWSAVERIEVLPDGASALYGSDAIAGVVNVILRDDVRGAETQTRLGEAPEGRDEKLISQLFGTKWSTGKAMFAYQYADVTPLMAADRPYAANSDKTAFGGGDYRSFYSNPGNLIDPRTFQPAYGIPAGQNGASLTPASLSSTLNLANQFAGTNLFPERRSHAIYTTVTQAFGDGLDVHAEGRFSQRNTLYDTFPQRQFLTVPRTNPYFVDPFGDSRSVLVAYNFLRDLGPATLAAQSRNYVGTLSAHVRLGHEWQARLSETFGRETLFNAEYNVVDQAALTTALADPNPATAFNAFGDGSNTNPGTLQEIRRVFPMHAVSTVETTNMVADGPLFKVPAGYARLAVGVERRQEALTHDVADPSNPLENVISQHYSRHVSSAFGELSLPLIGDSENRHAVPRLELALAGRYEDYSDFGHTFNPTARLRWVPSEWLKFRASWGRSFRAPKLDDLYDTAQNVSFETLIPDPRSPTGTSVVLGQQGSNPNLKQETAITWTAGFDIAPTAVPGLRLSLTYYAIDYEGRIAQPAADDPFNILAHEGEWAPVIVRNPTLAQIAAICNRPDYQGSAAECLTSSPAAIIDFRLSNLASTKVNGVDLEMHHLLDTSIGSFSTTLTGTYVLHFDQAVTTDSPSVDVVDTVGNPISLRLRGALGWTRHRPDQPGPGFNLTVNHSGGYRNPTSSLIPGVDPWTTIDCQFFFRTGTGVGWASSMDFVVNAVNVFNQDPPFVDSLYGYDRSNMQPLGRVVSLFVRKSW